MQGVFENESMESGSLLLSTAASEGNKRTRLDAVANNAPWRNLLPANNKETLQAMRQHREKEAEYGALTNEQKKQVPGVNPYPETPDAVFPGTPCYRMTVQGKYVYVFVLDPASTAYPSDWDGKYRKQSTGYWIVPHFIYRDAKTVRERKEQWKAEYDRCAAASSAPPEKIKYKTADGSDHTYFAEATDNVLASSAPKIKNPLFSLPFNNNTGSPKFVTPFPYDQNKSEYPQRPKPNLVPVAGGIGAAGDSHVVAGGKLYHYPHESLLDTITPRITGRAGADWIEMSDGNYEVSADFLKTVCERAEELDYMFAQSMQGLRGTNISAVWTCTDPEYDVTDRSTMLAQFVKMYMDKFYTHISVMGSTDVEEVVHEALQMHEEFCKGWVHRHHRTLSAEITAASEALVGLYYDELKGLFPRDVQPTRTHISRFLRRHPDYCGEFSHCLYHYMTSLEHMRGNRNPSYKAMNNERVAQITALRKMGDMLFNGGNRAILGNHFGQCRLVEDLVFDLHYIDWHYIAAQMPQHHKEFDGFTNSFNLYRSRTGGRANAFPPWQQMRMTR